MTELKDENFLILKSSKNVIVKTDYKKVFKEMKLETTRIKQCVYNEIEAYIEIKSKFIPMFYDYKKYEDKMLIIVEYIDGKTLYEYKSLPRNNLTILCLELSLGLRDIFRYGYIHGDIKPENIISSHRGCYYIDLGFSSKVDPFDEGSKYIRGTIPYMIPELVLGLIKPDQLNADILRKNDIYALGNVFHYVFTGHTVYPFTKRDNVHSYQKKLKETEPIIKTNHRVFDDLISKMVHKEINIDTIVDCIYDIWLQQQIS